MRRFSDERVSGPCTDVDESSADGKGADEHHRDVQASFYRW